MLQHKIKIKVLTQTQVNSKMIWNEKILLWAKNSLAIVEMFRIQGRPTMPWEKSMKEFVEHTVSLRVKIAQQGYYLLTLNEDAKQIVRVCNNCQRFASTIHQLPELLTPISSSWPFAQWGVDLIGPLPIGKVQTRFVVVAVDYFTGWLKLIL